MALAHPLPADLIELIADRFRVLSEPTRITLLDRLRDGEASVGALSAAVGTSEQSLSKHLGMLQRAGIVARRKEGNFVYYLDRRSDCLRPLRDRLRQPRAATRLAARSRRGRPGAAHFEDGTLNFLNLPAVEVGLRLLERISIEMIRCFGSWTRCARSSPNRASDVAIGAGTCYKRGDQASDAGWSLASSAGRS